MGNIKCECQVVRRRSWCQQDCCSPGTFPPRAQHPPSLNPAVVRGITSPSWHTAGPWTSKKGFPRPWQRKAISPPGGSPGCPPGISSGSCTLWGWKSVWVWWGPSSSVGLYLWCMWLFAKNIHPYLVLPVPELNWLFIKQKPSVTDEIYAPHILLPNNNNGLKNSNWLGLWRTLCRHWDAFPRKTPTLVLNVKSHIRRKHMRCSWQPLCHPCQEQRAELRVPRAQGSLKSAAPFLHQAVRYSKLSLTKMCQEILRWGVSKGKRKGKKKKSILWNSWLLECKILHH